MRLLRLVAILIILFSMCLAACSVQNGPREMPMVRSVGPHPAAEALDQCFAQPATWGFKETGLSRKDYLKLISGNVDHFKQFQRADGAIIDPIARREIQYSTPAFAAAAGLLTREADRKDLLDPAARALSCSLTALLARRAADNHSDFYIPLIMHAYRQLKDEVPSEMRVPWEKQLQSIEPERTYRADMRAMNWNIVSDAGELLRRKDGMVTDDKAAAQLDYLERCLDGHVQHFTRYGMYEDPNAPLAYDAFARLWLEDMMADGAYDGKRAAQVREFLRVGGLSTLLLLSPSGEWASGGRSAFHQWNEAAIAAICEMEAVSWKKAGRAEVAGAFKRAAHAALQSLYRWQRPTGELWIVKNRAPLEQRVGFESYSYTSQYNLLPMAMLAMAYERSDESIAERPMPSEAGAYVFDVRETFHKIVAACGGNYVEIDTAADPHYNATGLQRIHTAGVLHPPLSDSTAEERAYGPSGDTKSAMTPGLMWKSPASEGWRSLADFSGSGGARGLTVAQAGLKFTQSGAERVSFEVDYALAGGGEEGRHVIERYVLSKEGVELTAHIMGGPTVTALRWRLPVLTSDGAEETTVTSGSDYIRIGQQGSILQWSMLTPGTPPTPDEAMKVYAHYGPVTAWKAEVAGSAESDVRWMIRQWTIGK